MGERELFGCFMGERELFGCFMGEDFVSLRKYFYRGNFYSLKLKQKWKV